MPPKHSPSAQGFEQKPFESFIRRTNPTAETIETDSVVGPDTTPIPHPMMSPNSWIRALPERGGRILSTSTAGGTLRRAAIGYYSRAATEYVTRYQNGRGLYRPLKPGEWELMTPGVSHIYGTVDGRLRLRGGLVWGVLDSQKLHALWRAPTHRRELHLKKDSALLDEERFGVVVRHKSATEKHRWLRGPDGTAWAKEYSRFLGRGDNALAVHMEGDLFDKTGEGLLHSVTGRSLRELRELYDDEGNVTYQQEIDDEKGAINIRGTADRINITESDAAVSAALRQMEVALSGFLKVAAASSINIQADTTGRYGGSNQTIVGPSQAPVDAAMKGTTFNATVMAPLLSALTGYLGAQAAVLTVLSLPSAAGGPSTFGAAKAGFGALAGQATALTVTLGGISSALGGTLSGNVKISP